MTIAALFAAPLLAAVASLTAVNEYTIAACAPGMGGPNGLSGLTRVAGDAYWTVNDRRSGTLHPMTIGVDRATGAVTNVTVGAGVPLAGRTDCEGVAWDDANGWVWVSDETDNSIRAFAPATGAERAAVDIPDVYRAFRFNRSFEALTMSVDGREMWTCNEEALSDADAARKGTAPGVEDGPMASRETGTWVRVQRFVRRSPRDPWAAAGQWAYKTDPLGGAPFLNKSSCGVAGACLLEDGTLLLLEREMSLKRGSFLPSVRCRVYAVSFAGATDVSARRSLADGAPFVPAAKTRVLALRPGFAMYEGICRGPRLADGSRSVLMISDGDTGAAARVCALKCTFAQP